MCHRMRVTVSNETSSGVLRMVQATHGAENFKQDQVQVGFANFPSLPDSRQKKGAQTGLSCPCLASEETGTRDGAEQPS